ncbi:hypothetical protein GCM10009696_32490 [Kocuria himachalensis]
MALRPVQDQPALRGGLGRLREERGAVEAVAPAPDHEQRTGESGEPAPGVEGVLRGDGGQHVGVRRPRGPGAQDPAQGAEEAAGQGACGQERHEECAGAPGAVCGQQAGVLPLGRAARRAQAAGAGDEHEPADALGVVQGELERHAATGGHADHVDRFREQLVQHVGVVRG